jgi:hypothetical protein
MQLLHCQACRHAFIAPDGSDPRGAVCLLCGGALGELARDVIQVSPLEEGNESRTTGVPGEVSELTSVAIRRRQADGDGARILADLGDYFPIVATESGAQVSVDRGPPSDAAWRVAAILDGIDAGWEQHLLIAELDPTENGSRV